MPRHEIGNKVFLVCLAAIAAAVIVAAVALDAKDVALRIIDVLSTLHHTPGMEGVTS